MKKLSANTINYLLDVRLLKKKVILCFASFNLEIAPTTYIEFKPYVGKTYKKEELDKLIEFDCYQKYVNYVTSLISKYVYTSFLIKQKLIKKGASEENIQKVIKYLEDNNLIDDNNFTNNFVYNALINHQGPYKIKRQLKEKGINEKIIDEYLTKYYSLAKEEALRYLKALDQKISKNIISKKEKIISNMLNRGYEKCLILELLSNNPINVDFHHLNIKKDYDKFRRLYQNKDKIIMALKRKGYHYIDIKKVMEDINNEIY